MATNNLPQNNPLVRRLPVVAKRPEPEPEGVEAGDGAEEGELSHGDAVRVGVVICAQRQRDWVGIQ